MAEKTNTNSALIQYGKLDSSAQCLATAMLQLMTTMFQCIQQAQTAAQKASETVSPPAPEA